MTDSVRDLMREWSIVDTDVGSLRGRWRLYGATPIGDQTRKDYTRLKRQRRRIEARIYKLSPQLNSWGPK